MAKLLVLIGVVCAFAVAAHGHTHRHVRERRGVPYPGQSTPYYSPYGTYPSGEYRQWQANSGTYQEIPQPISEAPAPEMIREAIRETLMEAPQELVQEAVFEAPIIPQEALKPELSIPTPMPQQEQLFDALMQVSHVPEQEFYESAPQEQYGAPMKIPLVPEKELYEPPCIHAAPMAPQMPGKDLYEPSFLHAPPLKMQEALYESPMNTYPLPRHSGYPFPENYNQYPVRDSYLQHGDSYPWQKPAYFPDQYRNGPSPLDLPNYHNDLFYPPTPKMSAPTFDPFKKPIIVDEVTKPLIVEHFQAPVVVDCYQKPIVISHFIPPIINDFYEAPEFVEKAVELDLEQFLAPAPVAVQEPCPLPPCV